MDLGKLVFGNTCLKDLMESAKRLDLKLAFVDVYNSEFKILHAEKDYAVIRTDQSQTLVLPYGGSMGYEFISR